MCGTAFEHMYGRKFMSTTPATDPTPPADVTARTAPIAAAPDLGLEGVRAPADERLVRARTDLAKDLPPPHKILDSATGFFGPMAITGSPASIIQSPNLGSQ